MPPPRIPNIDHYARQKKLLQLIDFLLDELASSNYFTTLQREFLDKFMHKIPEALSEAPHDSPVSCFGWGEVERKNDDAIFNANPDFQGNDSLASSVEGKYQISPQLSSAHGMCLNAEVGTNLLSLSKVDIASGLTCPFHTTPTNYDSTDGLEDSKLKLFYGRCQKIDLRSGRNVSYIATSVAATSVDDQLLIPKTVAFDTPESFPRNYGKGESMIQKMGYAGGGLGRLGTGILEPILPSSISAREGIGNNNTHGSPVTYYSTTITDSAKQSWDESANVSAKFIKQMNKVRAAGVIPHERPPKNRVKEIRARFIREGNILVPEFGNNRSVKLSSYIISLKDYKTTQHYPGVVVEALQNQKATERDIEVKVGDYLQINKCVGGKCVYAINMRSNRSGTVTISALEMENEPAYEDKEGADGDWFGPSTKFASELRKVLGD